MAIYNKAQKQLLLDDLNAKNPDAALKFTLDNVTFSLPKAIDHPKYNTMVMVRARQGHGYVAEQPAMYNRLDLGLLFKNFTPMLTVPNIGLVSQGVKNINGRYGLNLEAEDVVDYYIYRDQKFTLAAKPNCYQYVGSCTMLYSPQKRVLEDLIVNPVMSCLNHPVPLDGRLCAKMVVYGLDFTRARPLFDKMKAGSMSVGDNLSKGYSAEVVAVMSSLGFPAWDFTGAQWTPKKVSAVADANKRFTDLIHITQVNDRGISGDIYLHFNR